MIWNRREMKPKWGITEEMNLWVERDENDVLLKNKIQKI